MDTDKNDNKLYWMSKMLPDLSLENDDSWTVTMEQGTVIAIIICEHLIAVKWFRLYIYLCLWNYLRA